MAIIKDILSVLENNYPLKYSEKWDKSGLQVGDTSINTSKILLALDPLEEVIDYAVKNNIKLIVTHHPMALKPIFPIDTQTYPGRIIKKAILNDITIYSAHTNFDSVEPTVSDALLDKLGFKYTEKYFIQSNMEKNIGFGRIIKLTEKMAYSDILNVIKEKSFAKYLRFVGDIDKVIGVVAIMGGSGASFIEDVYQKGADLYITGDIKYHDARLAQQLGLSVIDLGHFYSERHALNTLKTLLELNFKEIFINIFNKENDPFILWR